MRIAFIIGLFPCMSETFILKQIAGLIDRGHEVDIFAQDKGESSEAHPEVEKYNLINRTSYRISVPDNYFLRVIKGLKLIFTNCYKHPVVLLRSLNIFKYGRAAASLRLLYLTIPFIEKKYNYDIIHCHFGPNGLLGARLREVGAIRGKLITTFHGYDVSTFILREGEKIYRELFRQSDLFTYNSEATKQKLVRLNCPNDKLVKLPMGVDLQRSDFVEKKIKPGEQVRILSVGRLVEMKGREYAIRAVGKVFEKFPNVNYIIVGDGPLRVSLQNLIRELQVNGNISLTGWVSSDKLDFLYQSCHLFLHPSVISSNGNMEGQGVVLLEAQACGFPIVATRHNAFPETVVDGKSAFLIPERDVDALTERLLYLIEHPEIWPEMGRAGRAYVEANYDINKLNDRLVEIYKEVLS